jgi:hypothetical protein
VACLEPSDCGGDTPACDVASYTCVRCTTDSDCDADNPVCDVTSHACVGCLADANCSGDLAHCDLTAQRCVGCLQDGDCSDAAHAHCDAGACSACSDSAQCAHLASAHTCVTAGDKNAGVCVECATDADCADVARPQCQDNQCATCSSDDACANRPNATVCDDGERKHGRRGGKSGTGACVECDADHEDVCGDRVCDAQEKRCSDRGRQSARLCAPCLSDSECDGERICASVAPDDPTAAAYCVVESNLDSCLESCAQGVPLACALGF